MRRTPLAYSNLIHSKARTLTAVAGVCFAVILLFLQLGFFSVVLTNAVLIYSNMNFDLLLVSRSYVYLNQTESFSRRRLAQARALPEVEKAMPFYVARGYWRNPETRIRRAVLLMAFDPSDPVFTNSEVEAEAPKLKKPDSVLIDRYSRPDVGPQEPGLVTEAGHQRVELVGQFTIGPGFNSGTILMSDRTYGRVFERPVGHEVSLGLIKLVDGANPEDVAKRLQEILPNDVEVLTRPQLEKRERWHWVQSTSTGIVFGSGVIVAFAFGIVIIYQVLSSMILDRLAEYATLKAIGYPDRFLSRVVLQQAMILGAASYIPGFLVAVGLYRVAHQATKLPIGMTSTRAIGVLLALVIMGSISGFVALRLVRRAEPADLFS